MGNQDNNRLKSSIWGALVADAAAVGLHWLYDQKRISQVAPETPEFQLPDSKNYNGVPGYYAHDNKAVGDFSHYAEQMMVMLRALAANNGSYNKFIYENTFRDHFGYGGNYVGYIDRPTRITLDNMARVEDEERENNEAFYGADDVQLPAISKLPPLVASHLEDVNLSKVVKSSVRVTNNNDLAVACGHASASLIKAAIHGNDIDTAVNTCHENSAPEVSKLIEDALSLKNESNIEVTSRFGMSCNLAFGLPSLIHNLVTAESYVHAIRNNILAGGDSCGRAILLGSVLGATRGIGGAHGIPEEWIDKLTQKDEINQLLKKLFD